MLCQSIGHLTRSRGDYQSLEGGLYPPETVDKP